MAFMMPVMKNNYDIYKDSRSRKTSECSNASSNGAGGPGTVSSALGTPTNGGRRRKVSECKSESFATSPSHNGMNAQNASYRMQMQRCQSTRAFPRNASRTSSSSVVGGTLSPTRSFCGQTSLKSPTRTTTATTMSSNTSQQQQQNDGQNEFSKFHLRLVDKLRKSFRKDNAKRS